MLHKDQHTLAKLLCARIPYIFKSARAAPISGVGVNEWKTKLSHCMYASLEENREILI